MSDLFSGISCSPLSRHRGYISIRENAVNLVHGLLVEMDERRVKVLCGRLPDQTTGTPGRCHHRVPAGGVILNVLKEELPEERKSRIAPFFLDAFGYAAILLLG